MYSGVPTTRPVLVTFCFSSPPAAFAMPKSTTLARSNPPRVLVIMMLSGFKSRCTMPNSWAASSASAVWRAISAARFGASAPSRLIRSVSDSPSMNSIAR